MPRTRHDGGGDGWAEGHRRLGGCYMCDIDGLAAQVLIRGEDALFAEYVADGRRHQRIRDHSVLAIFDRKSSEPTSLSRYSTAFLLWLCRTIAAGQGAPVRFFFVVGTSAPWTLIELDTVTGDEISRTVQSSWRPVWHSLGLLSDRASRTAALRTG